MKYLAIIPARYGSTRFPGKPLADIGGKTMIRRVFEQSAKVFDNLFVATDDTRIFNSVIEFGGDAVMTSESHPNGTGRALEAMYAIERLKGERCSFIINIQGDEPFVKPEQLKELITAFNDSDTEIATLVKKIELSEEIFNPNIPKVVFDKTGNALYFSRSPIPYVRDSDKESWINKSVFYKHVGLYGYRRDILERIVNLNKGTFEEAESLEQLRWLEFGFKIKVTETTYGSYSIDTPADIENLRLKGII